SSIGFDARFEFLTRTEGNKPGAPEGIFPPGFGVAARPLILVSQIEITESRELDLLALGQRAAHLFEEEIHEFAGFAFVQTELVEQCFGHLGLRESHERYSLILASKFDSRSTRTAWTTRSASSSVRVRVKSCKIKPKATLFRPVSTPLPW